MRKRRKQGRTRGTVVPNGRTWWARYSDNGARVRRNTNVPLTEPEGRALAERYLAECLAKVDLQRGAVVCGRVTFEQLAELVRQDYVRQGRRSLERAELSLKQLGTHFAGKRAEQVAAGLDGYVDARLAVVKSGTVRLEVACLKRAFNLAVKKRLLAPGEVPPWPTLEAGEPREGFFERDDFERVASHLPEPVASIAWLAYFTGMRSGEILSLTWANVDRQGQVIRLNKTKNGKRRTLAYGRLPELVALIERQHGARVVVGRGGTLTPWLFHRDGEPVRDFRGAWAEACNKASVPGRLFHDLRRTAVRNLVRAGVPDVVAMSISGHKTRAVFDRYNIVNEADVADALGRLGHSSAIGAETAANDEPVSR